MAKNSKDDGQVAGNAEVDAVVEEQVTVEAEEVSEVPGPGGQFPKEAPRDENGQPMADGAQDLPVVKAEAPE